MCRWTLGCVGAFVFDRHNRLTGKAPLLRGLATSPAAPDCHLQTPKLGLGRIRGPTKQFGAGAQTLRIVRLCYQGIAIKPVDVWDILASAPMVTLWTINGRPALRQGA